MLADGTWFQTKISHHINVSRCPTEGVSSQIYFHADVYVISAGCTSFGILCKMNKRQSVSGGGVFMSVFSAAE